MKIVFDNIVLDSTLSSLRASLNYPIENLQNSILKNRYQSVQSTDTITIDFSETLRVSSFFYSYTNATYLQLRLYVGSDSLVFTLTITDPESETDAKYFTAIEADYAELDIIGPDNVYLGGIALDDPVEFPDPDNAWQESYQDNSSVSENDDGNTNQDYIKPLRINNWIFRDVTRYDSNFYKELYILTGIGKIIWVDAFEDNHDYLKPLYCKMTAPFQPKKNGRRFNFELSIKEAR